MWNYADAPEHRHGWSPMAPVRSRREDERYHNEPRLYQTTGISHMYAHPNAYPAESSASASHGYRPVMNASRHGGEQPYVPRPYMALHNAPPPSHAQYGPLQNTRPTPSPVVDKSRSEQPMLPSQLTPSCSRCRQKKLKCQFEERGPHAACTNCMAKGLGHDCHRDLRTPRGKKGPAKPPTAIVSERNSEIAALKRRLSQLEDEVSTTGKRPHMHELGEADYADDQGDVHMSKAMRTSMEHSQERASVLSHVTPLHAASVRPSPQEQADYDAAAPTQRRLLGSSRSSEERDAANVLEALATAASKKREEIVDVNTRSEGIRSEGRVSHDSAMSSERSIDHRTTVKHLIRKAKESFYMDDLAILQELCRIYSNRLTQNIGQVIYGPGMKAALEQFINSSVQELQESDWVNDPARVAVVLLVLCLGWESYPLQRPAYEPTTRESVAINEAREQGKDPAQEWFRIARALLPIDGANALNSIAALQAACLFLGYGQGGAAWLRMVQLIATDCAQDFGLHRLGRAVREPGMDAAAFIRLETGVRIWNYLVLRDWCGLGASSHGRLGYYVQPEQCTTRLPLNVSDEDLDAGMCESRPLATTWTPLSIFIMHLKLADVVRQGIDIGRAEERHIVVDEPRRRGHPWQAIAPDEMSPQSIEKLQRLLLQYIERLPEHFMLGSEISNPRMVVAQKWQLHHEIFDLSLALSRKSLASTVLMTPGDYAEAVTTSLGRTIEPPGITCRRFARAIVEQHHHLRRICPVVDSFTIHYTHLYSACVVGIVDLISRQLQKPTQFSAPPTKAERHELRGKLQDVIERLAATAAPTMMQSQLDASPIAKNGGSLLQAQQHGTHILDNLLAFEQEVASAPVPLYTLDGPELAEQRRELSAMARQICIEAGTSASQTSVALAEEKECGNLTGEDVRARGNSCQPALLLPLSQCRKIPQSTLLPIIGVWQPVSTLSATSQGKKSRWPVVSDGKQAAPQLPSVPVFGHRPQLHEDDAVAITVLEWAVAMRGRSDSTSSQHEKPLENEKQAALDVPMHALTHKATGPVDRQPYYEADEKLSWSTEKAPRVQVSLQQPAAHEERPRWLQAPSRSAVDVRLPPLSVLHPAEALKPSRTVWSTEQPFSKPGKPGPPSRSSSEMRADYADVRFSGPTQMNMDPNVQYRTSWRP